MRKTDAHMEGLGREGPEGHSIVRMSGARTHKVEVDRKAAPPSCRIAAPSAPLCSLGRVCLRPQSAESRGGGDASTTGGQPSEQVATESIRKGSQHPPPNLCTMDS